MRMVYLLLSLAGLAVALRKSPAQEARGFVVTKFCQVRVTDLATAKGWAGAVGAAMHLLPATFPNQDPAAVLNAWIGVLNFRLWGDCNVWTPLNLKVNGLHTYTLFRAALQAAILAGACNAVHALGFLNEERATATADGVDVSGWPADVQWQ